MNEWNVINFINKKYNKIILVISCSDVYLSLNKPIEKPSIDSTLPIHNESFSVGSIKLPPERRLASFRQM